MCFKKYLYFCTIFMHTYIHTRETVASKKHIGWGIMALVMCLLVPVFSYAQASYAHVQLGANYANAYNVQDTVTATVEDGDANFFKLAALHLPATVCYFSDSVFGPLPVLVKVIGMDSMPAVQVVENCRTGWRWELPAAAEDEDVRYLYFSAHENGATAEIRPFVCHTYQIALPDTTACDEYVWGDTTIVDSRTYTRAFKTAAGCDSIVTQKVTISSTTVGYDHVSAYDTYTWMDGQTYTRSSHGGHTWQILNVAGCDSLINLDLTIRHLQVNDTLHQTVCLAPGASYAWRGKTYAQSGIYSTDTLQGPETNGICRDTLHTLDLTVNPTTSEDVYKTVEGESYVGLCGVYDKSGDYTCTITNHYGCDSTIILHLTLIKPEEPIDTVISYFCTKSGIVEHVDTTSDPRIWYKPYIYVKPTQEIYLKDALAHATDDGADVNFRTIEANLDAYYVEPLMPVTAIFWRYQPRGGASLEELNIEVNQPQWVAAGTISMEIQFLCGQRYYGSFTVGAKDQAIDQMQSEGTPIKYVENGQVVILRGGMKYNLLGTKIQ